MHHAYLLVGEREATTEFLHSFWHGHGVILRGSPDFFLWDEDLFGIDEARELSHRAAEKAFVGKKVFFLAPQRITQEAQNALLKTFEDPKDDTHFFLSVRDEELVLPTLRSRMEILRVDEEERESLEGKKFLSLPYKERLAFAKKFGDSEKNLSIFLDELLKFMREERLNPESIKAVYEARRYSDDRAASARLILEHLALVL